MPSIHIESGVLSANVKRELMRRVTEVSAEVTGIPKDYFFVSIHELPNENLAIGGKDVNELQAEFSARRREK